MDVASETAELLAQARQRGSETVGSVAIPPGLDHFTAYVGLIGSALELGKLIETEERDLKVIGSHHEIEMARIAAAFREVEAAMLADFQREGSLRDKTFETINLLVTAGQHEIALKFYERFIDGFKRGALEMIIELRNRDAARSNARIELR
jgi:hypothetical protein